MKLGEDENNIMFGEQLVDLIHRDLMMRLKSCEVEIFFRVRWQEAYVVQASLRECEGPDMP